MFHTIRSIDRAAGTAENFRFELTVPINDISEIELVAATIPTHLVDNYYIRISELNNKVLTHSGTLNYSTFVIPHHHAGNPASSTEYTINRFFKQAIRCDPHVSVNHLHVQLCGDNGLPIAGASEWNMILKITQHR